MNNPEQEKLEAKFHQAMLWIYEEAKRKYGYNGTIFLQMIRDRGGLAAAKMILNDSKIKLDVFTELFMRGGQDGLKLTVEALALDPKWKSLFTDAERRIASKRTSQLNYKTS
jgi:hypothetical protein